LLASTSSCAHSATAPGSPTTDAVLGNFGITSFSCSGIGPYRISVSSTRGTGAIGGVILVGAHGRLDLNTAVV
jgi:hypothetical protein